MLGLVGTAGALGLSLPGMRHPASPPAMRSQVRLQATPRDAPPQTPTFLRGRTFLLGEMIELQREMLTEASRNVASAAQRELELREKIASLHERRHALDADKAAFGTPHLTAWRQRIVQIEAEMSALTAEREELSAKLSAERAAVPPVDPSVAASLAEAKASVEEASANLSESTTVKWGEIKEKLAARTEKLETTQLREEALVAELAQIEAKCAGLVKETQALEAKALEAAEAEAREAAEAQALETAEAKALEAAAAAKAERERREEQQALRLLEAKIEGFKLEKSELTEALEQTTLEKDAAASALYEFYTKPVQSLLLFALKRDGVSSVGAALARAVVAGCASVLIGLPTSIYHSFASACKRLLRLPRALPFRIAPPPTPEALTSEELRTYRRKDLGVVSMDWDAPEGKTGADGEQTALG